jgi:peptide/nickel transport system substrate-binding protein
VAAGRGLWRVLVHVFQAGLVTTGYITRNQVFNNVLIFDPYKNEDLRGDLVESWSFDSTNTVLTMKVRQGVKWHDGAPFTAGDVAYTLTIAWRPPEGYISTHRAYLGPVVKDIRAPDDRTVVMELLRPSASLLARMTDANLLVLPAHIPELDVLSKRGIGTGPFKVKGFERDISVTLERNADYWDKDNQGRQLPYVDTYHLFWIGDRTLFLSALRTGRVKFADVHRTPAIEAAAEALAKDVPGIVLDLFVQGVFGPFFKNTAPFNDPRVREAIDLWLDRKAFIDIGYAGRGSFYDAAVRPVEQGGKWGLPPEEIMSRPGYRQIDSTGKVVSTLEELQAKRAELRKDPRDQERAKELLAQAGIKQGDLRFEVPVPSFEIFRGGPVFLAQMKELFGATWTMRPHPTAAPFDADIRGGRFTVAFPGSHSGYGVDEPSATLTQWLRIGSLNPQILGWPETDPFFIKIGQLFEEQETTLDFQKRRAIVWDIQRAILDWRIRIVTSNAEGFGAYWPEVRNPPDMKQAFTNGFRLDKVWLAK